MTLSEYKNTIPYELTNLAVCLKYVHYNPQPWPVVAYWLMFCGINWKV